MSVLKDYAPFSGPSDRFSYDLVMDGPEKGKCRSIISISLINWNLFIFKIYLPLRLTLVSVFENAKENV